MEPKLHHKALNNSNIIFTDSSRLITESLVKAGADVFIGYPITPANLLYQYASKRYPVFMAAPDEITTLQWMSGFAVTGHIPVTATSFPGYALMIESINMACMMELPMIIILVQRLGPATGTATRGAQGDISVLHGTISGAMSLPSFTMSDASDCWEIPAKAVEVAVKYRTPVVLLTSKEEVMTMYSLDKTKLGPVNKANHSFYNELETFVPYEPKENLVPEFLPVTSAEYQVRFTASTHDKKGIIQNAAPEALENSKRLHLKITENLKDFTWFELDEQPDADTLLVSFGITAQASREAVTDLRREGVKVSMLIAKTLLPVPNEYYQVCNRYKRILIAEENLTGQYRQLMFGIQPPKHIEGVNEFGHMISPEQIKKAIKQHA